MKRSVLIVTGLLVLVPAASAPRAQQGRLSGSSNEMPPGLTVLAPTAHPQVPRELSQLWLAPERGTNSARPGAFTSLNSASKLTADGDYSKALTLLSQPIAQEGPLGQYAAYYAGVAQLRLRRAADALKSFRELQDQKPVGYLWEAAALGEAEADEALGNPADAVRIYERLLKGRLSNVEDVYMRLGRAARAANDDSKAAEAFAHVFYEFPLGENAAIAGAELNTLTGLQPLTAGSQRYKVELGRAERLFGAKQYGDARTAFDALRAVASGDDRELLQLRIAECDYFTRRARSARESLSLLTNKTSRKGEALFFYALASRDVGDTQTFLETLERIETEFPEQTWAEDALNNLATHYLKADDDDRADALFRELYAALPARQLRRTCSLESRLDVVSQGSVPGHDACLRARGSRLPSLRLSTGMALLGRPGTRAAEVGAPCRRIATRWPLPTTPIRTTDGSHSGGWTRNGGSPVVAAGSPGRARCAGSRPRCRQRPDGSRAALAAEMYDDALNELRYAQRVWGDSPAIEATVAWTRQQQARTEAGMRRFQLLRGAINTMRRAYPQFMAAGGEDLPREVLTVIFPVAYWDLIRKYAEANGPRSVLRRRARRAGVDLRGRREVRRKRVRARCSCCRPRRGCMRAS